jgi:hypothetical protein
MVPSKISALKNSFLIQTWQTPTGITYSRNGEAPQHVYIHKGVYYIKDYGIILEFKFIRYLETGSDYYYTEGVGWG